MLKGFLRCSCIIITQQIIKGNKCPYIIAWSVNHTRFELHLLQYSAYVSSLLIGFLKGYNPVSGAPKLTDPYTSVCICSLYRIYFLRQHNCPATASMS